MADHAKTPGTGSPDEYRPIPADLPEPHSAATSPDGRDPATGGEPPLPPAPDPLRPGRVHLGTSPGIRRAGRTAAILGAIAFVILVTVLSARYSGDRSSGPASPETSAPVASSMPLTAERIEDFARRQLERRLRAARPAPAPPDLRQAEPRAEPPRSSGQAPEWNAGRLPEAPPAAVARNRAIDAPLTPRGAPGHRSGSPTGVDRAAGPSRSGAPAASPLPELPQLDRLLSAGAFSAPGIPLGGLSSGAAGPSPLARDRATGSGPSFEERRVALPDASAFLLTRRPAPRQPVLYAGTAVPLTLTHGLSSDVPGPARAVVSRDVYDSLAHRHLVLPRGTLVLGHQAARSAAGDRRLLIAWTELKLPDGASYRLPQQPAGAEDGTAGARGHVDNHWWSRFGSAVGLSLVGAGVQLSQPQGGSLGVTPGQGFTADEGQILAQQLGLELGRLSQEVFRRGVDRAPTISLEPGQGMTLLLTRDLLFPAPFGAEPALSPAAP